MRTTSAAITIGGAMLGLALAARAAEAPSLHHSGKSSALVKTGKLAVVRMIASSSEPLDLPDVPADDPSVVGATLKFYELGNATNQDTFALPAAGWRVLGDAASPRGFRYRGTGTPGDPCTVALIKPSRMRAKCRGADVTLSPPLASAFLAVTLTVGPGSKQYCPAFVADVNAPALLRGVAAIVDPSGLCQ